ncbi:hypothetical protein L686_18190 [Stutzerimonas stutzeri MF28]|nr:hypothetical protein L686_18190 [Stutzerimonas stutzeri MF28]
MCTVGEILFARSLFFSYMSAGLLAFLGLNGAVNFYSIDPEFFACSCVKQGIVFLDKAVWH